MLAEIETAIIANLQEVAQSYGFQILSSQEIQRSANSQANTIGVVYFGGNVGEPQLIDSITQMINYDFRVFARMYNLQTHNKLYPMIEAIRQTLTGLQAHKSVIKPMIQLGRETLQYDEKGFWISNQTFRTTVEFHKEIYE